VTPVDDHLVGLLGVPYAFARGRTMNGKTGHLVGAASIVIRRDISGLIGIHIHPAVAVSGLARTRLRVFHDDDAEL
jgi:hypothetical protein